MGYFEIGWLEERRTRRHTYQLEWSRVVVLNATRPPVVLALGAGGGTLGIDGEARASIQRAPSPLDTAVVLLVLVQRLDPLAVLVGALSLLQRCMLGRPSAGVWVLTASTHLAAPGELIRPCHAGPWGVTRSARAEAPLFGARCVDVGKLGGCSAAIASLGGIEPSEGEVLMRRNECRSPRLVSVATGGGAGASQAKETQSTPEPGVELITGGTGGLGLLTAGWLAGLRCASRLVLVSRTGTLHADDQERLRASGATVYVRGCDVSEPAEARDLMATVQQTPLPLLGVWHTAGVLADGLLARQDSAMLRRAYGPKVRRGTHKHACIRVHAHTCGCVLVGACWVRAGCVLGACWVHVAPGKEYLVKSSYGTQIVHCQ